MRLDGEAWRSFFDAFEHEAFRLETHQTYSMASEQAEYEDFQATGKLSIPEDDPWLVRVRHFRETDRSVGRVHVVAQPLSDYLRYEFAVYSYTIAAGEDVRILDGTTHPGHGLPQQDFWLFDEIKVVRMDYDEHGRQLGRELLEGVDPTPYVERKRRALELAVPFPEYAARLEE